MNTATVFPIAQRPTPASALFFCLAALLTTLASSACGEVSEGEARYLELGATAQALDADCYASQMDRCTGYPAKGWAGEKVAVGAMCVPFPG